jgi:hypothetical protein
MAPKYHPTPLSGGDRKALKKELGNSRAMATILSARSAKVRAKGEALISEADKLLAESWNERMWADGGPIDPSPTVDQAINGGYSWLAIECSRCKTKLDVDLATLQSRPWCRGVVETWCRWENARGDLRTLRPLLAIDRLRSRARLRLHK